MTIGAGIAICGMWAATAGILWTYRKTSSPFAAIVAIAIAAWATAAIAGFR